MDDTTGAASGNDRTTFDNVGNKVFNQIGSQTIHGGQVNNFHLVQDQEIYRQCLASLQCPEDPKLMKIRLKLTKGDVLKDAIAWVLNHDQYRRWMQGDKIGLLWIRGGAGKGKTMMSIGLIDELIRNPPGPTGERTTVLYFFCQNADQQLNKAESIVKGLMGRLFEESSESRSALHGLWDEVKCSPREQAMSLMDLWVMFSVMLDKCDRSRIYIVVDALDECDAPGLQTLLKLVARDGLTWPRVKWLLTSRPQHEAEHAVFPGNHDREQLSLDLESAQLARAVAIYISNQVDTLASRHRYDPALKNSISDSLERKAEGTFLWVALACQLLENHSKENALATLDSLPPGLHDLYVRIFRKLGQGETGLVKLSMHLLKAILLAFRPLRVDELDSIIANNDTEMTSKCIDLCSSLIRRRRDASGSAEYVEFVHQSARDYIAGLENSSDNVPDPFRDFGHGKIALNALSLLDRHLKMNILDMPWPSSEQEFDEASDKADASSRLSQLRYAATSWAQHFCKVCSPDVPSDLLLHIPKVIDFLENKVMEWLECLSWLQELDAGVDALRLIVSSIQDVQDRCDHLAALSRDALRLVLRHFHPLSQYPLNAYSAALVYTPSSSLVRQYHICKVPKWMPRPVVSENEWPPLIQLLEGHTGPVVAVAYAPDGQTLASASWDETVRVWDASSGRNLQTLDTDGRGMYEGDIPLAFAPDSKLLALGCSDGSVLVWECDAELAPRALDGHIYRVKVVVFSPNGQLLASGSDDKTVRIWDVRSETVIWTLDGHEGGVETLCFSLDSQVLVSGSSRGIVRVWDVSLGKVLLTQEWHGLDGYRFIAATFTPDGKKLLLGSSGGDWSVWDVESSDPALWKLRTARRLDEYRLSMVFAPNGRTLAAVLDLDEAHIWRLETFTEYIASGSGAARASDAQIRVGLTCDTITLAPNGRMLASTSNDSKIRIWSVDLETEQGAQRDEEVEAKTECDVREGPTTRMRVTTEATSATLERLAGKVHASALAPNGRGIALIAGPLHDRSLYTWTADSGSKLTCRTLIDHDGDVSKVVFAPDGQVLAAVLRSTEVNILHVESRSQLLELQHESTVSAIEFAPDGRTLATTTIEKVDPGPEKKQIFRIWDTGSGAQLRTFEELGWTVTKIMFISEKSLLASTSHGDICVWDIKSGTMLRKFSAHYATLTPDGRTMASYSPGHEENDHTLDVWDVRRMATPENTLFSRLTGRRGTNGVKPLTSIKLESTPGMLRWSPGGTHLVTGRGCFRLELPSGALQKDRVDLSLESLGVWDGWIRCGSTRLLQLPGQRIKEWNARGDLLVIRDSDLSVSIFHINRAMLQRQLALLETDSPRS